MKVKFITYKKVLKEMGLSRSENWMVDAPEDKEENFDLSEFKSEQCLGCKYKQFFRGDWWCTFELKGSPEIKIDDDIFDDDKNILTNCPNDVENCPLGLWDEDTRGPWTKEEMEDHHADQQYHSKRDEE
jgi:hypothetical protein